MTLITQPERVRFSGLCCEQSLVGRRIPERPNFCVEIPMYCGTIPRIPMRVLDDGPDAMHKNSLSPLYRGPILAVSVQKAPQPTLRQRCTEAPRPLRTGFPFTEGCEAACWMRYWN
jgi:hypothetical protein